jgi:hypothetical protein
MHFLAFNPSSSIIEGSLKCILVSESQTIKLGNLAAGLTGSKRPITTQRGLSLPWQQNCTNGLGGSDQRSIV